MADGMIIPTGPVMKYKGSEIHNFLNYSEYVVYNSNQVRWEKSVCLSG